MKQAHSIDHLWLKEKEDEITSHPAWHGCLNGMDCEALLRGMPSGTYLLRQGEDQYHYYLSYVIGEYFYKHQPFIIKFSTRGWFYQNGCSGFRDRLIELIPMAMHCDESQCTPLIKNSDSEIKACL